MHLYVFVCIDVCRSVCLCVSLYICVCLRVRDCVSDCPCIYECILFLYVRESLRIYTYEIICVLCESVCMNVCVDLYVSVCIILEVIDWSYKGEVM